jgi:DNA-binding transcriptional MerR regulator
VGEDRGLDPADSRRAEDVTAVPERTTALGDAADQRTPRLTIGEVLAVLRDDFPDVTISKIRYLESEDLVHPQRTPSGYRKFSRADVSRLRYVLAAQRDQYLPLRVIKDHLDALDRGEPLPAGAGATAPVPPASTDDAGTTVGPPLTAEQFARAAGLEPQQLADCVQFGLLATDADGRHPASDLPVARAAAGLARHGIEPRHLRVYRTGVEREAGLVEQLVAPVLRARSEEARTRATEKLRELATLSAQLHTALLEARLQELLRP